MDNFFERLRESFVKSVEKNIGFITLPASHQEVIPLMADGKKLLDEKDYVSAKQVFSKVLKLDPDNGQALRSRAICYISLREWELALADINTNMRLYGNTTVQAELRGIVYQNLKLYKAAIAEYTYLIESGYKKNELTMYSQRAACAYRVDKMLAIHDYTYLIEMQEDRDKLKSHYIDRGYLYYALGDYDSSVADYRHAIRCDREDAQSYRLLCDAFEKQSKYDDALLAIEKAIELVPDNVNGHRKYAHLLLREGKYEASIEACHNALASDPSDTHSHNLLAFYYPHIDDLDKAMPHITIAIERGEPMGAFFDTRAQIHWLNGDYDKALQDFETAQALNPSGLYLMGQAITHYAMNDHEQAIALRKEAIKADASLKDIAGLEEYQYTPRYIESAKELMQLAEDSQS